MVAAEQDWDYATELVALAREESARGKLLALPCFVDRLEGRTAAASGDWSSAETLLRRSADGFANLAAPWEQALSKLLLAEVLLRLHENQAAREVAEEASAVFLELRSTQEMERSSRLIDQLR